MPGFARINEFINYDIFVEEKERIRENAKPKTFGFGGSQLKCQTCAHLCQTCIDISKQERENKAVSGHHASHTLCWCCEKSVKGGCEWADVKRPVPGWVAERDEEANSFKVIDCPKFKRGR